MKFQSKQQDWATGVVFQNNASVILKSGTESKADASPSEIPKGFEVGGAHGRRRMLTLGTIILDQSHPGSVSSTRVVYSLYSDDDGGSII